MTWSVHGKNILVTGATSGIGLAASVVLADLGASVILVGRDPRRTATAIDHVYSRTGARCRSYLCDVSSQASVRQLAARIAREHHRLDVLINNAGGVSRRRTATVDGIETTFATNHLGYFLLTVLLRDLLTGSAPARVVTVASEAHRQGSLNFDDLGFERGYGIMRAYARSKLANVLFAAELARRLAGTGVTSNSVHPGTVRTNIWSRAPFWSKPAIAAAWPLFRTVEAGAATLVHLAASPGIEGQSGLYFRSGKPVAPAPLARDAALARRLWEVSETMVAGSA